MQCYAPSHKVKITQDWLIQNSGLYFANGVDRTIVGFYTYRAGATGPVGPVSGQLLTRPIPSALDLLFNRTTLLCRSDHFKSGGACTDLFSFLTSAFLKQDYVLCFSSPVLAQFVYIIYFIISQFEHPCKMNILFGPKAVHGREVSLYSRRKQI